MQVSKETEALCNAVYEAAMVSTTRAAEVIPAVSIMLATFMGRIAGSHEHCLDMVDALNKSVRTIATDEFVKTQALRAKRVTE